MSVRTIRAVIAQLYAGSQPVTPAIVMQTLAALFEIMNQFDRP